MPSAIEQITGREFAALIAKPEPVLVWFDGTPAGSGYTFLGFARTMEHFADRLRGRVVTVLLDVEEWDDVALAQGVYGAPELVLFKAGREIARPLPGRATLLELLLWISPHVAHDWGEVKALYRPVAPVTRRLPDVRRRSC